jgi:AraC-like DNA-binding protein
MASDDYPKVYLYRRIVQAKLFIDSHFADTINLEDIADEAFFSKFHFIRLFKKTYGRTPHQYLIYVRIENAKTLLETGIPASEVCGEVGFSSISSFTDLFKRRSGKTPSAYQAYRAHVKQDMASTPLKYVPTCFAEQNGWVKMTEK